MLHHRFARSLANQQTLCDTSSMFTRMKFAELGLVALFSIAAFGQYAKAPRLAPASASGGQLNFPEHYREWVYLTTGFDMSYSPGAHTGQHKFDNIFVNPEAYKVFAETGTWPDKTVLVLEIRGAEGKGSINQKGNYQGSEVLGLEVHVKDEARFPAKWAFFDFDSNKTAKMFPTTAECYSCHAAHAAVDTTFVQFYPTLLPIARRKGTLSASYQRDVETPVHK